VTARTSTDKLPSGRWRARLIDPTGKWKSLGTFPTRRDARSALDAVQPAGLPTAILAFAEFAETKFFPFEYLAASTAANQPSIFKHYVLPRWGGVQLHTITVEQVETWARVELPKYRLVSNSDKFLGDSLRKQVYWMFHKIIAKAVERGYIVKSPLPRQSGIKKSQPRRPERILAPDQVETLAAAHGPWSPVVFSLAYGGFRIGEAFALRLNDLDFDACLVTVDEKAIEIRGQLVYDLDLKRSRSHRRVPMPPVVMEMLAAMTMHHQPGQLVFGTVRPSNWRTRVFTKAVKTTGFPHMTPHDLRHTAASTWFDAGFDLVEVARMLGDSLDVAEQTYVHIYEGRRPERMSALDGRIRQGRADASNVVPLRRVK